VPKVLSEQTVADYRQTLTATESSQTLEFAMDATATKATFILSWAGSSLPGRLIFELLTPDGKSALPLVRFFDGPSYRIAQCYFPLAAKNGRPLNHTGTWRMIVGREGGVTLAIDKSRQQGRWKGSADFRAYLITDVPDMTFDVHFSKPSYRAGDDVQLSVSVLDGLKAVRTLTKVTATISKPGAALGTVLSKASFNQDQLQKALNAGGDILTDLAAAKSRLVLTDSSLSGRLHPLQDMIELLDDGDPAHGDSLRHDGVYSARLGKALIPGLITVHVMVNGMTARNRAFTCRFTVNAVVDDGQFSPTLSKISVSLVGASSAGWTIRVSAQPKDGLRNYLGPGFRDRIAFEVVGGAAASAVQDRLDGSYTQIITVPSLGSQLRVRVGRDVLLQGSVFGVLVVHYLIWLLLFVALLILIAFLAWLQYEGSTP
jgi:hypothetical protein